MIDKQDIIVSLLKGIDKNIDNLGGSETDVLLSNRITTLENSVKTINTAITGIESTNTTQTANITSNTNKIDTTNTNVSNLTTRVTDVENKATTNESNLNTLNERVTTLENAEPSGGGGSPALVSVTHSELVTLRNESKLIPGQQYRITDYVATTIDPESRSANHPFDIIVTADSENVLNENARAIAHEGDTYFEKCDLSAWQLKYSIDNDASRWDWAQEEFDGYVVDIPIMGISLNATLESSEDTTYDGYPYRLSAGYQGDSLLIYSSTIESSESVNAKLLVGSSELDMQITISYIQTDAGKGVIFGMIDENNNNMQYDFKGIQFKRYKITACDKSPFLVGTWAAAGHSNSITIDKDDFRWCYLFNIMFDEDNKDDSIGFYGGTPANCTNLTSGRLPNGVCNIDGNNNPFSCYGWTCGSDCYNWTCGSDCSNWTCGSRCSTWTCGDICNHWTCGNGCYSWTCGTSCRYWNCGDDCSRWNCGNDCRYWTCGSNCYSWTSGDECYHWTCGNNCYSWNCGNRCNYWTSGNNCYSWTCGDDCYAWTCGNDCTYWNCGDDCYSWTSGNSCFNWTCGNGCYSWTCGDECGRWTCGNDCRYFRILNGTNYSTATTIPFTSGVSYPQFAGFNSSKELKVWCPADLVTT